MARSTADETCSRFAAPAPNGFVNEHPCTCTSAAAPYFAGGCVYIYVYIYIYIYISHNMIIIQIIGLLSVLGPLRGLEFALSAAFASQWSSSLLSCGPERPRPGSRFCSRSVSEGLGAELSSRDSDTPFRVPLHAFFPDGVDSSRSRSHRTPFRHVVCFVGWDGSNPRSKHRDIFGVPTQADLRFVLLAVNSAPDKGESSPCLIRDS